MNEGTLKECWILVPDITVEQARSTTPCVMLINLPPGYQSLGIIQIQDPLAGILPGTSTTVAYAFLVDADKDATESIYTVAGLPHRPFQWLTEDANGIRTAVMGLSSHNGVPLVHLLLTPAGGGDEKLVELGYVVVGTKKYDKSEGLLALYNSVPT